MKPFATLFHKAAEFLGEDLRAAALSDPTRARATSAEAREIDELVLDVSPSMEDPDYPPSRLAGAQAAAIRFLERRREVTPSALVGVVAFSATACVAAAPVEVAAQMRRLRAAVEGLTISDATNIAAGLELARREIQRVRGVRNPRVLLLTDGHSNTGPDPEAESAELKRAGIQLDIIGIGGSPAEVNEPQLKRMASVVQGERRYWFIRSVGELVRKFETLALREIR